MRWLRGCLEWIGSAWELARSTSAARLMGAATDLNGRLNAAIHKRDDAYERKDFRDYGRAIMELKAVQIDRLQAETSRHV